MQIGLISRGRTYSTIVAEVLSQKHNIINMSEYYICRGKDVLKYKLNDTKLENSEKVQLLEQKIIAQTKRMFDVKKKFVCKIWPSNLILPPNTMSSDETYLDMKNKTLFNLSCLSLDRYKTFYFLDRDLHYSTVSWIYSNKTSLFHKHTNIKNVYPKIDLDDNDYNLARFYIYEYCLQQKIKNFLHRTNIPYTLIDENNIDQHNKKVLPTGKKLLFYRTIEQNNENYNNLITNVEHLHDFISQEFILCSSVLQDIEFYNMEG